MGREGFVIHLPPRVHDIWGSNHCNPRFVTPVSLRFIRFSTYFSVHRRSPLNQVFRQTGGKEELSVTWLHSLYVLYNATLQTTHSFSKIRAKKVITLTNKNRKQFEYIMFVSIHHPPPPKAVATLSAFAADDLLTQAHSPDQVSQSLHFGHSHFTRRLNNGRQVRKRHCQVTHNWHMVGQETLAALCQFISEDRWKPGHSFNETISILWQMVSKTLATIHIILSGIRVNLIFLIVHASHLFRLHGTRDKSSQYTDTSLAAAAQSNWSARAKFCSCGIHKYHQYLIAFLQFLGETPIGVSTGCRQLSRL